MVSWLHFGRQKLIPPRISNTNRQPSAGSFCDRNSMGLVPTKRSLALCDDVSASSFCRWVVSVTQNFQWSVVLDPRKCWLKNEWIWGGPLNSSSKCYSAKSGWVVWLNHSGVSMITGEDFQLWWWGVTWQKPWRRQPLSSSRDVSFQRERVQCDKLWREEHVVQGQRTPGFEVQRCVIARLWIPLFCRVNKICAVYLWDLVVRLCKLCFNLSQTFEWVHKWSPILHFSSRGKERNCDNFSSTFAWKKETQPQDTGECAHFSFPGHAYMHCFLLKKHGGFRDVDRHLCRPEASVGV